MNRRNWLVAVLAPAVAPAFGQDAPHTSSGGAGGTYWVNVGSLSAVPAVTGAAYSADEITEDVQTLADGTHITQKATAKMYRDSAGRTRIERRMFMPGFEGVDMPMMIDISDPVAHVYYMLDEREKVARKQTMASPETVPFLKRAAPRTGVLSMAPFPPPGKPQEGHQAERPEMKTEKLGSESMEGLLVEGTRFTTTWPAGSMGNDRPITSVSETWISSELQIVVLSKTTDPRSGEHTQKLINVSRVEPDTSLFHPPADYSVTEDNRPAPL